MKNSIIEADIELAKYGYTQKLSRSLGLWSLVSFGLMYLQPIGPAVVFGYIINMSGGTVALPYLIAFIGMLFTIKSYSVLIQRYPLSGSVYNYVKLVIGPFWGFIAGWVLALDYILIPTITSVSAAIYAHHLLPQIPYEYLLLGVVGFTTSLNIYGVRCATLAGSVLLIVQILIVLAALLLSAEYILSSGGSLISVRPFNFKSYSSVLQASGLAIFSFLGFDAITTMAEEAVMPKKDIPKAMMLCSLIGFIFMFLSGYLAVLTLKDWSFIATNSVWQNEAFQNIAKVVGGNGFSSIFSIGLILAMLVSNLVGTTSAARLLYSMGRDGFISKKALGSTHAKWQTPVGGILLISLIEITLGSFFSQDQIAELINYGAVSGFILLNLSALKIETDRLNFLRLIFPVIAITIMAIIYFSMPLKTLICGSIWVGLGSVYYLSRLKSLTF